MTQAQSMARKKLKEILSSPRALPIHSHSGLAVETVNQLRRLQRKARNEGYTITFEEQGTIEVCYEMCFDPPVNLTELKRRL